MSMRLVGGEDHCWLFSIHNLPGFEFFHTHLFKYTCVYLVKSNLIFKKIICYKCCLFFY